MTKQEIKDYVKEHKKEIIVGTGLAVGTIVSYCFGVKLAKNIKLHAEEKIKIVDTIQKCMSTIDDVDVKLDSASVTEAWYEGGYMNFILNDFTCKDIGVIGDEILKKVPDIKPNQVMTCILSTTDIIKY